MTDEPVEHPTSEESQAMLTRDDFLPIVNKYNAWGVWRPFMFPTIEKYLACKAEAREVAADPDLEATLMYSRATGHEGIEFILLSEHWDEARFHMLSDGIVLVRLWDVPPEPERRPFLCAYDGWLPVEDMSALALRAALRRLQDFADFFGYQYGVPTRMYVKYRECVDRTEWRDTNESDAARLRDRMAYLQDLPGSLRTAVLRAIHWHQNSERQARASDRFISLWLALESIALVLYENAGLISLSIDEGLVPLTRRQKMAAQDTRVEGLLEQYASATPSERVQTAYFEGVKSIRRRVEATLRAILGEDERIAWLYSKDGPSDMRSKLVHNGWSEADISHRVDLGSYCRRLDLLFKEIVERVLRRIWTLPIELPRKDYALAIYPENVIASGSGWTVEGDFTITLPLLAHKRVLRF